MVPLERTVQITLERKEVQTAFRSPRWVIEEIDQEAQKFGRRRSDMILILLQEALAVRKYPLKEVQG